MEFPSRRYLTEKRWAQRTLEKLLARALAELEKVAGPDSPGSG